MGHNAALPPGQPPSLLLPPFGKEDQPGDWGPNRLALHHSLLLSLGEEGNLVVDILQHDEYRGLTGQLLGSVILKSFTMLGLLGWRETGAY